MRARKISKLEAITGTKPDPVKLAAHKKHREAIVLTLRSGQGLTQQMQLYVINCLEYLSMLEGELARTGGRLPDPANALMAGLAKALHERMKISVDEAIAFVTRQFGEKYFARVRRAYYGKLEPWAPPDAQVEYILTEYRQSKKK